MAEPPSIGPDQPSGDPSDHHEPIRSGFCAILGLPNVGKSTLLNRVLGVRLVAVSRKPQTTRNRILGVHNTTVPATESEPERPAQIIFVDTPGIQKGPGALRRYMRDQALDAVGDSDVTLTLVDVGDSAQRDPARFDQPDTKALVAALGKSQAPAIAALNKIDLLSSRGDLLPVIAAYAGFHPPRRPERPLFGDVVPISARQGNGVDRLVELIAQKLPLGPRLFPEDMVTDRAERFLAGELIREQLFHQLGQELPYASAVVIESFRDRAGRGDVIIEAVIYVERDSQKGIVVGAGGRRIKALGQRARGAISQMLGCPVHVKLFVKVASDWSRFDRGIRQMGYE